MLDVFKGIAGKAVAPEGNTSRRQHINTLGKKISICKTGIKMCY